MFFLKLFLYCTLVSYLIIGQSVYFYSLGFGSPWMHVHITNVVKTAGQKYYRNKIKKAPSITWKIGEIFPWRTKLHRV